MHYQDERNHGCRVSDAWTYRGLKTAVLENELLRIVILVDKGADIYQFVHKPSDIDFLWRSPWGVRDPSKFVQTTGNSTEMWLDHYEGGWQTVLPAGGLPSSYKGVELGLHAEISTVPWDAVIVSDTPERVSILCKVRTARTPFYYEKTHTLVSGSSVLFTEETLVNEGRETQQVIWGQHIAIGGPFLSNDCVIDLPGGTLLSHPVKFHPDNRLKPGVTGQWPWGETADGDRIDMSRLPPRNSHIADMSYITDMPDGWYAVTNQKLGVGFGVSFPKELYKYLWYWQSFGGSGYPWYGRTYNVGLEPFTSWDNTGLAQAIENGTALTIEAGQRITASHKAIAYTGTERVRQISPDGSILRTS